VTPSATAGILDVKRSGATLTKSFEFQIDAVGATDVFDTGITILRNDPWAVIVRCSSGSNQIDVTLRQGCLFAEVAPRWLTDAATKVWSVELQGSEGTTSQTGGLMTTGGDADGNFTFMMNPAAVTVSTRYVKLASASSATKWSVGMIKATDPSYADLLEHFLVNVAARQRVVAR